MTLRAPSVDTNDHSQLIVVFLHGQGMSPEDLLPFAQAIGLPAVHHFLRGPCELADGGRAWWPRDPESIERRTAPPWDLAQEHPSGREAARRGLADYLRSIEPTRHGRPVVLIGFSQGGMLACDALLHEEMDVHGLALLSSCRIAFDEWLPRLPRFHGLPVFVCHGQSDEVLSSSAGEALRDAVQAGGAQVEWLLFDGAHEIPLVVWHRLRSFLQRISGRVPGHAR